MSMTRWAALSLALTALSGCSFPEYAFPSDPCPADAHTFCTGFDDKTTPSVKQWDGEFSENGLLRIEDSTFTSAPYSLRAIVGPAASAARIRAVRLKSFT